MTPGQAVRTRSEPVAAEELDSMVNGSSRIKIEEMPECKVSGGGDNEIWLIITQGCLAHEAAKDSAGVESESLASLNVLAGVADDPIMAGEIGDILADEILLREFLASDEQLVEMGEEFKSLELDEGGAAALACGSSGKI